MTFTASAVALLMLLLPGIAFRGAWLKGTFAVTPYKRGAVTEEAALGLIAACVVHAAILGLAHIASWTTPFSTVSDALNGRLIDAKLLAYTGAGTAVGWIFGLLAHVLIRAFDLDIRFPVVRFDNSWFYLLEGESRGFGDPDRPYPSAQNSSTLVSVIVKIGDKTYVYRGTMSEYGLDKDGALAYITIAQAARAPFDLLRDEPTAGAAFVVVPGDVLVIPAREIVNLALRFGVKQQ